MSIEPLPIGVCSWVAASRQRPLNSSACMDGLGIDVVQIACGDPHHAFLGRGRQHAGRRQSRRSA